LDSAGEKDAHLDQEGKIHVLGDRVLPVSVRLVLLGDRVDTLELRKKKEKK